MTDIHEFAGRTLSSTNSVLGEGADLRSRYQYDLVVQHSRQELHGLNLSNDEKKVHALPVMASVLAQIDAKRQLLATEQGPVRA